MPQTREHLAIVDLLGVGRGVVALTKVDLVSAERRQAVVAEITQCSTIPALPEPMSWRFRSSAARESICSAPDCLPRHKRSRTAPPKGASASRSIAHSR